MGAQVKGVLPDETLLPTRVCSRSTCSTGHNLLPTPFFLFLYYMPNDRTSRTQHPDCVVKTLVIPLWVRDVVSQPVTLVIAFNI